MKSFTVTVHNGGDPDLSERAWWASCSCGWTFGKRGVSNHLVGEAVRAHRTWHGA